MGGKVGDRFKDLSKPPGGSQDILDSNDFALAGRAVPPRSGPEGPRAAVVKVREVITGVKTAVMVVAAGWGQWRWWAGWGAWRRDCDGVGVGVGRMSGN